MGAGQIGGIATLLDLDFDNAAGFVGHKAENSEAQYLVYFMSHVMIFCVGSLIEAHVVLTPATCIYGEKYMFEVFAGSHVFVEHKGVPRMVEHICVHRGFNYTTRYEQVWGSCSPDNLGLLLLDSQYLLNEREEGSDYMVGRIRYGIINKPLPRRFANCKYYGWGSRRNGYLVPLLLYLQRVDVEVLPKENCQQMWNYGDKYLCLQQRPCLSSAHGELCPDDMGSALECDGFLRGMMTSRIIDRACGVGFLNLAKYYKFLTCSVDDSRDIISQTNNDYMFFDVTTTTTVAPEETVSKVSLESLGLEVDTTPDANLDPGPPKQTEPQESGAAEYDAGAPAPPVTATVSETPPGAGEGPVDAPENSPLAIEPADNPADTPAASDAPAPAPDVRGYGMLGSVFGDNTF